MAREILACETTADYFRLLKLISEKIEEIKDVKSELKQKLQATKQQILTDILLPGKTLDGLSQATYEALQVAGYLDNMAGKTKPQIRTQQLINKQELSVDFTIEEKNIFVNQLAFYVDKMVPDIKILLQKAAASFYACKTSEDYLRHYHFIANIIDKMPKDGDQYFNALKSCLQENKTKVIQDILLVGKVSDGLLPRVLEQLKKYVEAQFILERMPVIEPVGSARQVNDYLLYLNKLAQNITTVADKITAIDENVSADAKNEKILLGQVCEVLTARYKFIAKDILLAGRAVGELPEQVVKHLTAVGSATVIIEQSDAKTAPRMVTENTEPTIIKKSRYQNSGGNHGWALNAFEKKCKNELDVKFAAHKLLSSNLFSRRKTSVGTGFNIAESLVAAVVILCGMPAAPFVAVVHGIGSITQSNEDAALANDDKKFVGIEVDESIKTQATELFNELYKLLGQKIVEKYPYQILQLKHAHRNETEFDKVVSNLVNNIIRSYDGIVPILTQAEKEAYKNDLPSLKQVWLDKFAEKLIQGVENDSWLSGSLVRHANDGAFALLGQRWNTNSMFARAGLVVKTADGCIFYNGHGTDPAKYGYRFASLEEVNRLNFKPDQKANNNVGLMEAYAHLYDGHWNKYEECLKCVSIIEKQIQVKQILQDSLANTKKATQESKGRCAYLKAGIEKLFSLFKAKNSTKPTPMDTEASLRKAS